MHLIALPHQGTLGEILPLLQLGELLPKHGLLVLQCPDAFGRVRGQAPRG